VGTVAPVWLEIFEVEVHVLALPVLEEALLLVREVVVHLHLLHSHLPTYLVAELEV